MLGARDGACDDDATSRLNSAENRSLPQILCTLNAFEKWENLGNATQLLCGETFPAENFYTLFASNAILHFHCGGDRISVRKGAPQEGG